MVAVGKVNVTFNLTSSILPLITSLKLVYGLSLQVNPLLNLIPMEEISTDGEGNMVVAQLPDANSVNYLFRLQTVIGFYVYDSDVVQLNPTTEATPTDMTTLPSGSSTGDETTFTPSMSEFFLPAPMTVLVGTPVMPTSILVMWSKLAKAIGYVIHYYNDNELVGVISVSVHFMYIIIILCIPLQCTKSLPTQYI